MKVGPNRTERDAGVLMVPRGLLARMVLSRVLERVPGARGDLERALVLGVDDPVFDCGQGCVDREQVGGG